MKIDFLGGGTNQGKGDAVDSQATMNFYPEIPDAEGGAKEKLILVGTPGLKLFLSTDPV